MARFSSVRQGFLALFTICLSLATQAADPQLIAYFPEWGVYQQPYYVKNLITSGAAARLTVLNYAFAIPAPGPNGDVVCTLDDPEAAYQQTYDASMALDGVADTGANSLRGHFNQLRKLKQAFPNLKILVAIGGWTGSTWFSDAAIDATSRQAFVASCIDTFLNGNLPVVNGSGGTGSAAGIFDGFDIDWEYPITGGDTGVHHSSADDVNLTALLVEFRAQLNAWATAHGSGPRLLTMAAPGSDFRGQNYQINIDQQHLDWFNLMTYDFHGTWENSTGHLTNILTSVNDPSSDAFKLSLDNTVRLYRDVYGVPVSKLVGGATFYGLGWKNVSSTNNGLYQGGQTAPGIYEAGTNYWRDLAPLTSQGYSWFWDDKALAAWLYSPAAGIFWTLDDPQSLALKSRYAGAYGLKGMMLWEISGDDTGGSLLAALDSGNPGSQIPGVTNSGGPAIAITQPADCAISLAGFNQVINANAGGAAKQVEYFAEGPLSLGYDNRAPWSWAWFNLPAGDHVLTAVATDATGKYTLSSPVRLTVYGEDSGVALWQTGATYATGDEVFYEGCIYAAKRTHVGSRVRLPSSDRYWTLVTCSDCGGGGGSGQLPTVHLTSPSNGASFTAPATVNLAATAGDTDGTISRVEFYQATNLLSSDTAFPYEYSWIGVAAGSYTLRAVAVDNQGNTAEDSVSVTVVTASGCSLPAWSSTTTYQPGALVQHKGIKWKAKRESVGVEPGTSPAKWTNLGTCTA